MTFNFVTLLMTSKMNSKEYSDVQIDPNGISKEGISLMFGDSDEHHIIHKVPCVNIDTKNYNNNDIAHATRCDTSTRVRLRSCISLTNRIFILLTGILLGLITSIPNMMAGDSGTNDAMKIANLLMFASIFFIVGGIMGCINKRWIALLPGFVLQVSPFILYDLIGADATIIVNVIFLVAYCRYVRL